MSDNNYLLIKGVIVNISYNEFLKPDLSAR